LKEGERRIDVIEFISVARALGRDPVRLLRQHIGQEPFSKQALSFEALSLSLPNLARPESPRPISDRERY
jgi:hypothetical protein